MRKFTVYDANTYQLIAVAEQARMIGYGAGADEAARREATAAKARAKKIIRQFAPASRTANTDITSLTLAAMADRMQQKPKNQDGTFTLRPVGTVMDGQVREHQRQINMKAVRRAAGAEGMTAVPDLRMDLIDDSRRTPEHIDFNFENEKPERANVRLFDGDDE